MPVIAGLECEIVEPKQPATACVIWLHGLGADGHDFVPVVKHLKLPKSLAIRFIFPHAPLRPVTCNGGIEMRAWYDILALTEFRQIDEGHLQDTSKSIASLIQHQITQGIPSRRIVMIGFSQGGAVAYHSALHYPKRLGGLIALSTYLGISRSLESTVHNANRDLPIFIGHGDADDVVTTNVGEHTFQRLNALGYEIEWHTYPIAHEVCLEEIHDIGEWLTGILK